MHLFVVFALPTTGLHKNEALSSVNVFLVERTALSVLDSKFIRLPVDKFEGGENLGQLAFDFLVQGLYVVESRKSEHDVTRGKRGRCCEDGDACNDAEGTFRTNE